MKKETLKPYLIASGILMAIGFIPLPLFEKGELVLFVNRHSSPEADYFIRNFTHLGDGIALAIFAFIVALFVRFYDALAAMLSLAFTGTITFIFKQVLFQGSLRPLLFLDNNLLYRLIEGVDFLEKNSFPSGHTMTAFTLATLIAFLCQNKYVPILALIVAAIIGISRIYLLFHFYIDVYFGALIGISIPFISYRALAKWENSEALNVSGVAVIKNKLLLKKHEPLI